MTKARRNGWLYGAGLALILGLAITLTNWPAELLAWPFTVYEAPKQADVVVVLGAGTRRHGDPLPPQAKERVIRGVALINNGYAPYMIISGGQDKNTGLVESTLMKDYAVSLGLPAEKILTEETSKNTWQNVHDTVPIMKRNGWTTALVVTGSYHTLRACTVFRQVPVAITCIATPLNTIPTITVRERWADLRSTAREYVAWVVDWLRGDFR